ncbi:MAG: CoxG family protein [Candidatus Limnocylindrales bacterium]
MRLEQEIHIAAPLERVWAFVTDLPSVGRCVPDVEALEAVDETTLAGTIKVRVGPIGLQLAGRVRLAERDVAAHRAALEIEATDRRIGGGINARTTFRLQDADGGDTVLAVATDATLLGRLGQFGQPIIRRKADEMARQFSLNVAEALRDADAT